MRDQTVKFLYPAHIFIAGLHTCWTANHNKFFPCCTPSPNMVNWFHISKAGSQGYSKIVKLTYNTNIFFFGNLRVHCSTIFFFQIFSVFQAATHRFVFSCNAKRMYSFLFQFSNKPHSSKIVFDNYFVVDAFW